MVGLYEISGIQGCKKIMFFFKFGFILFKSDFIYFYRKHGFL